MEVQQEEAKQEAARMTIAHPYKAKIIEFVGPPGAGKTSNCYCYTAVLRNQGYTVLTLKDIKFHIKQLSKGERTLLLLKTTLRHLHLLIYYALTLVFNKIFSLHSITRYVRIAVFDTVLRQMTNAKKYDYVLLEQWMIQELWSATIFRLTSYDRIEKQLHKFYLKTDQLLYFDIDMETASVRITNRTSKLSRFDRMDPKRRLRKLKQYNHYLYNLYRHSSCPNKYVISTKSTPEENTALFLQNLTF
jgi:thymidylate kinase